jgi:hypothetical protein
VNLDAFIDSQIKALRSEPSDRVPRPVGCLVVEKVATQCVAARAGVRKGDLLSLVDGSPAARQSPRLYEQRAAKRLLTFYSRQSRAVIELATTGIETGATFDYTAEAIHSRFKPADPDPSALVRLWELGDCAGLLQLSRAALATPGNEQTPALLFEGVGLWEQGEYEAGLERIRHYLTRYGNDWTMNFRAAGMHYLGLEALRLGQKDVGLQRLQAAFEYSPLESTADAIAEITGVRPPMNVPVWTGRPFPVDYSLETFERERKTVSLGDTLRAMAPGKLLCVCLLASYRSNGPYSDFLGRWHNYASYFAPFLEGLHVITMEPKRYPDREYHYRREDEVRALPLPFELLLEEGEVVSQLAPSGSPFIVLVDAQGTIRSEGELESVELWDALAR